MADFRGIGHQAANVVHQSIEGVLGTQAPSLDMSTLRDRTSEYKNGYSLVQDKKKTGLIRDTWSFLRGYVPTQSTI